jgi:hypothetical protein
MEGDLRPALCFRQRMADRLDRWYNRKSPHADPERQRRRLYVASLVNKSVMYDYARRHGIPVPVRHAEVADVSELDFAALPENVVIKPNNTANGDSVMLFRDGVEQFSGRAVPPQGRAAFVRDVLAQSSLVDHRTRILAEDYVCDHDPAFRIPRDYKIYVAGGLAHVILVVDRNHPRGRMQQSFYTRDWQPIRDPFQTAHLPGPVYPRPDRLPELVALAERIARDINCFMRLDFYISADRVIFGEFTSYPDAGHDYTPYADRMLCALMDVFPDEV